MPNVFAFVYAIWFFSEIALNRLMRASAADKQGADKQSLGLIWIIIVAAITAGVYVSVRYVLPFYNSSVVNYIGLALMVTGITLRLLVIRSLGKMFTVNVTIREGHQLKTDGFYQMVRHPSYTASLLTFIGFGISLNNWMSTIVIVTAVWLALSYRIEIEEKVLEEQFGEQYSNYQNRTKQLIPFLY
ncbi:MAG: isoprenylcysteine carboxylmethyltransferase family protein [Chitinophagales bacterium]